MLVFGTMQFMKTLPKLTVMIVTLNNERSLTRCLQTVTTQDYPKANIEYLLIDGGSIDKTKQIAKTFGFRVFDSPISRDAEAQRGVGLKLAKNNLIVSLDADNYLPHKNWLRRMVQPFIDDPDVVHAHTLHYTYISKAEPFNRYCALFGMADPIVYYVGLPDRVVQYQKNWKLGANIKETSDYWLVDFTMESLPTVGCNGVLFRRDVLLQNAQSDPEHFLHIDVFADVVRAGYSRFAVVKTDVIHDTAIGLRFLLKKRIAFLSSYYLKRSVKRRYLIYDPKRGGDRLKLALYVLYTVTLVKPLLDGFRGFLEIPDPAWFLHPIVCWIYLYAYGMASAKKAFLS